MPKVLAALVTVVVAVLAACAGQDVAVEPDVAQVEAPAVAALEILEPEPTAEPTATTEPTATPEPTPFVVEPLGETEALELIREMSVNPATKTRSDAELSAIFKRECPHHDAYLQTIAGDPEDVARVKLKARMREITATGTDVVENQSAIQDLIGRAFCFPAYSDILATAGLESYSDLF